MLETDRRCSRGQSWRWESTAEEGTKCWSAAPQSGLEGEGGAGKGGVEGGLQMIILVTAELTAD